ncbi:MAG: histidine kinase [Actinomycetota bacterium]
MTTPFATAAGWVRADPRRVDLSIAAAVIAVALLISRAAPESFDSGWPDVAAAVGAFVLVALRRRAPMVLLGIAIAWGAAHVIVLERPTAMFFAVLVLLVTSCIDLDRRRAIALGVISAAALYTFGLIANDVEFGDARAVIGIVWSAMAVGVADAIRSWRRYRESAEAEMRSTVLAAEAETRRTVNEERLTIARELHDLLAHNLSVMNVQTGAALHLLRSDPEQAEESLTVARDAGRTVLDELRELLAVLRDDEDTPISSLPTIDELPALLDTMRSTGLAVTARETGAPRPLSPAVSLAAYRIVQESLTNAAKHGSGGADLQIAWEATGLSIRVANDRGVETGDGSGHGLLGMRERATVNGGRLRAESVDARFEVDAWLPAAAEEVVS